MQGYPYPYPYASTTLACMILGEQPKALTAHALVRLKCADVAAMCCHTIARNPKQSVVRDTGPYPAHKLLNSLQHERVVVCKPD